MRTIIINWIRRALGKKKISDQLDRIEHEFHTVKEAALILSPPQYPPDPNPIAKGVRLAISISDPGSYFKCELNGSSAWLPPDTLRTMFHCVTATDSLIVVQVETAHIKWMIERLSERSGNVLFLDVGASTGAASIPIALQLKSNVSIVAFEPAVNAMRLLRATLEKNNIHSVTLVNAAVSDEMGQVAFVEFDHDPTGNCPFLPELSSISHQGLDTANSKQITVQSTTLDSYCLSDGPTEMSAFNVVVVKIDVEGFEEHVLKGAFSLIESIRPYFSIDIHKRINGEEGTTEQFCRELLSPHGYKFENIGHVLLAKPV